MSILKKKKKIGLNKKLGIKMNFAFFFFFYKDQSSHREESE